VRVLAAHYLRGAGFQLVKAKRKASDGEAGGYLSRRRLAMYSTTSIAAKADIERPLFPQERTFGEGVWDVRE
jgi:hypothetical protein